MTGTVSSPPWSEATAAYNLVSVRSTSDESISS